MNGKTRNVRDLPGPHIGPRRASVSAPKYARRTTSPDDICITRRHNYGRYGAAKWSGGCPTSERRRREEQEKNEECFLANRSLIFHRCVKSPDVNPTNLVAGQAIPKNNQT
jgi:hypothetical protein